MNNQEIAEQLLQKHLQFINYIDSLNEKDFEETHDLKWSAGQQMDHIYRAIKPLVQALQLPHIILKLLFGKANRNSKSYDELVKKYQQKLQTGGRASGRFIPQQILITQKQDLVKRLQQVIKKLIVQVNKLSENELDNIIIPHPLLGKITLREMMYFTIYHVEHHEKIIKDNLSTWLSK